MPRPAAAIVVSLVLALPIALLGSPASAAPAMPAKPYDFNGDGKPDLAAGITSLNVGGVSEAGGVLVLPASGSGLVLQGQVITQGTAGVPRDPSERAYWGSSLASADFDRDGYADLAVGPDLTIVFGSRDGLTSAGSYALGQRGAAAALVTGDVDGDGWTDLAVGNPSAGAVAGSNPASGAVRVYRGGAGRFDASRSWVLQGEQDAKAGTDVSFGSQLGVGDLDRDGVADLVVGSAGPGNPDDEGYAGPGSVSACYGVAKTGPSGCTRLVRDRRYAGNSSIVVGNVTGDARPEIVFGVPYPELNLDFDRDDPKGRLGGVVEILTLSGSGSGTRAAVTDVAQNSKGVRGSGESFDGFGQSVALGDLDRDGYADLVVGAPAEADGKKQATGRVTVVYGGKKGYRPSGGKIYDQGTTGIPGKPEKDDGFGYAVTLLDHDQDGRVDLDVGAPGENTDKGAVTTLAGSGKSFTTKGSRTFTLATLGITQSGDEEFGAVLGR